MENRHDSSLGVCVSALIGGDTLLRAASLYAAYRVRAIAQNDNHHVYRFDKHAEG
jgi:hypothetical protein